MAPFTTNLTNQPLGSVQQECYEQIQKKGTAPYILEKTQTMQDFVKNQIGKTSTFT